MRFNPEIVENAVVNTIPRGCPELSSTFLNTTEKKNKFVASELVVDKQISINMWEMMKISKK